MPNHLIHCKSLYLQQHAHNPVNWYPWGTQALEKAKKEQKWILLSIGYSSCHWCHVMEKESFEDPEVAAFLNEHFVSIKVDREERPDLDALYMEAVQMMSGHGGWPLNVWLTPELVPVYGGTYFPPTSTHHRPSFREVLERLVSIPQEDPQLVEERAATMRQALQKELYEQLPASDLDAAVIEKALADYRRQFDARYGGFSGAPKFPQAMGLQFLLRTGDEHARTMALYTLEHMIQGGIWDALGGGIHRYSTDEKWLAPHFEKMLYDQATVLEALGLATLVTGDRFYTAAMEDMLAFLARDMRDANGGFYSALDADTEGIEGATYTWTYEELAGLLSDEELTLATLYYGVSRPGNWEHTNILTRNDAHAHKPLAIALGYSESELETRIGALRNRLMQVRHQRTQPATDPKILLSWNALLLHSLILCHRWSGSEQALALITPLVQRVRSAEHAYGLYRLCYDQQWEQAGFLDDYAFTAIALLEAFMHSGDHEVLETALKWVEKIRNDFYDPQQDAFWLSEVNHQQPLTRSREIFDNALPSATSGAIRAFQLAGRITGDPNYRMIAIRAMQRLQTFAGEHGTAFGSLLQALLFEHQTPWDLVIVGPESATFLAIYRISAHPNMLVHCLPEPTDRYPLYTGKTLINGKTSAYLCTDGVCFEPTNDPERLAELLKNKGLHRSF